MSNMQQNGHAVNGAVGWRRPSYKDVDAFRYTHAWHAEAFAEQNCNFAYTSAAGWRRWNGTHWESELAESALWEGIGAHLVATAQDAIHAGDFDSVKYCKPTRNLVTGIVAHLSHMLERVESSFQPAPGLLNCKNGIVDLHTGKLRSHDKREGFTWCIDTDYKPDAYCAEWDSIGDGMFPPAHEDAIEVDGELVAIEDPVSPVWNYMQKCLGYSITGETREECAFYVHGSPRSGKGTLLNTVAAIAGKSVSDGISFSALESSKNDPQNFRLAGLANVRYLVASESDQGGRMNEALVKQLTGRDQITAARKGKDAFTFTPIFKLWLMSNYPINGRYDDTAFWGRFKLFTVTGKSHLGEEDTGLKDRLMQPANREGILAWLVAGAMRYYDEGLGDTPDVMKFDLKRQRDSKDLEGAWIAECLSDFPGAETSSSDLFASYLAWCDDNGIEKRKSKVGIGKVLGNRGYKATRESKGGKRDYYFAGVTVV